MQDRFTPGVSRMQIEEIYSAEPGKEIASGNFDSPEVSAALAANTFRFFLLYREVRTSSGLRLHCMSRRRSVSHGRADDIPGLMTLFWLRRHSSGLRPNDLSRIGPKAPFLRRFGGRFGATK